MSDGRHEPDCPPPPLTRRVTLRVAERRVEMTRPRPWPSKVELSQRTVDELVDVYTQAAAASEELFPASAQNEAADCVDHVYRELRARGIEAQRHLLPLIEHERAGVRGWAAAHSLEFEPGLAEAALAVMAAEGTIAGFTAATTLKEWREGRLRFP